jgi:hypothetical protein
VTLEVRDEPAAQRFELRDDGELVGVATYVLDGSVVVVPHTEISPDRRGEGLGAVLVAGLLDQTRAAGRTVRPLCWYVAQFVGEHPDYADAIEP